MRELILARGSCGSARKEFSPSGPHEAQREPGPGFMKEGSVAVARKQAAEASDTALYCLPVDPGGNSEQVPEVRSLQPLVVHDGGEMPVSPVPPTVVAFREAFTGNVGCDDKSRSVQALPARPPEPQEEFVILRSNLALDCLDMRRKESDS